MKGIPLAYNKDMQEDKELTFDAYDTVKGCLALFNGMLKTITFHKDIMEQSAKHGFTNATDAADYLVNHGVPFRDAHGIVGRLVLYCIDKGIALDDMSLEEYKAREILSVPQVQKQWNRSSRSIKNGLKNTKSKQGE